MRTNVFILSASIILIGVLSSTEGCKNDREEELIPDPVLDTKPLSIEQCELAQSDLVSALPLYSNLYQNYLQYGRHLKNNGTSDKQFGEVVGGLFQQNVDSNIFTNTCASRVSHALNLSGHPIPYLSGKTSSGGNGYKYLFRVLDLTDYMYTNYGSPTLEATDMSAFIGKKGIIIFNTQGLWSDASGHATLWNCDSPLGGNYAENPSFYFENSVNVMLWEAN